MDALVPAQVDQLARHPHALHERLDQLLLAAGQGEDRAVVIGVGMDIEQGGAVSERLGDGLHRGLVTTLGEVGNGLQREGHMSTLSPMREYYDARAPEYDDWYLGRGLFSARERPGWKRELASLERALSSLPGSRP